MNVQSEETLSQVRDWIHTTFPVARQRDIGVEESLFDSGVVDSLGTLDVVMFLESEFDIQITDEEMVADHFESIDSIARFVSSKQAAG